MKKKITLKELKVSCVSTSLNDSEKEKAKGGYYFIPGNVTNVNGGKENWTEIKTRIGKFSGRTGF